MVDVIILFDDSRETDARDFAKKLSFPSFSMKECPADWNLAMVYAGQNVLLRVKEGRKTIDLVVDFISGSNDHRRKFGGGKGQLIAKAIGVSAKFKPSVLDCTAGQGADAFVFASLGCAVTMVERSAIAYELLSDGLRRATQYAETGNDTSELGKVLARMSLIQADSRSVGTQIEEKYDVVYLDPMFPIKKKSALVKKEMRMFHEAIGKDLDADELLAPAKRCARHRVVVKRPKGSPPLAGEDPTYQLQGKSTRFDIYALKALPQ